MKMKCDIAQGYLFSRPVSAQEMEKLLTTSNPWKHLELEKIKGVGDK
jgi:predicted signal transduction protein with EAL and GGDEF domain